MSLNYVFDLKKDIKNDRHRKFNRSYYTVRGTGNKESSNRYGLKISLTFTHLPQLSQVEIALSLATDGLDKDNLLSLRSDIQELINLTKESLRCAKTSKSNEEAADPLADEYALFKVRTCPKF